MIDLTIVDAMAQQTGRLPDEIGNVTQAALGVIRDVITEYNRTRQEILQDENYSEQGKRNKLRSLGAQTIEALQQAAKTQIGIDLHNAEIILESKRKEALKPDESKQMLYSEIRQRIINSKGDDPLVLRQQFLEACSQGREDIACALLSDPFGLIDEQTYNQGLKLMNREPRDARVSHLRQADSMIRGAVQDAINRINKATNAVPEASFIFHRYA